ncbi:hypothetical protein Cch01nite_27900 [Cellulomonas chitinilytica]|uniref:Ribbon-helix-helix protein CopG domain-containing protein n=1 Tax=Cellulomonas chitinilytica TaxID=398759 RepID=A0A919P5M3_9CELL|nr:hypothetical protein [Cellulomonas chitinilytica]GIG22066.1 hypothetical protein Cch01nite_27900 [Cellulomonas chitinilytica]
MSKDYEAAADWAERDMVLPERSSSALRAEAAAAFGRDLVERSMGRPPLPEGERLSATQQVRLTAVEKAVFAELAKHRGTTPSALARQLVRQFVEVHVEELDASHGGDLSARQSA